MKTKNDFVELNINEVLKAFAFDNSLQCFVQRSRIKIGKKIYEKATICISGFVGESPCDKDQFLLKGAKK